MQAESAVTAVCLIRVESQSSGLLISVITKSDISVAGRTRPQYFTNIRDATRAVTSFLASIG